MQRPITGREFSATQKQAESRDGMTDLEKMRQWLLTCPIWGDTLQVDITQPAPGNVGLFPQGLEERARREDVLGNVQVDCRYRFTLYRVAPQQDDGVDNAQWLLDFQNWVLEQSAIGIAPQFGDVPYLERIQASKGALKERGQTGIYTVSLVADFTRVYEHR